MARFKVGVQLEPQHCSVADLRGRGASSTRSAWTRSGPGITSSALHGDPDGAHYEAGPFSRGGLRHDAGCARDPRLVATPTGARTCWPTSLGPPTTSAAVA